MNNATRSVEIGGYQDAASTWTFVSPEHVHAFAFEEVDLRNLHLMMRLNWKFALYFGPAFILTIFGLQKWMKERPAYQLRMPLFLWNFGFGLFSIAGFARMAPTFLFVLSKPGGFYRSICIAEDMSNPMLHWISLFILSKFVELGDLIFVVLRKRRLKFLQWYHHLVSLVCTWLLGPLGEPVCRWYCIINYGAHSFLYPYFALKSIGVHVPTFVASTITTLQLAEMGVGLILNFRSKGYAYVNQNCVRHPTSYKVFMIVYASFFLLFGKLFLETVGKRRVATKGKKTT